MNTLREYAIEQWGQEQERRKQSDRKKRKRRAKKIEEDIDDLLPRDLEGLQFERNLDDPNFFFSCKCHRYRRYRSPIHARR